jgi:L-aspartate oxidase
MVFGARAGRAMAELAAAPVLTQGSAPPATPAPLSEEQVRRLAWEHCGVVRSGEGLAAALDALAVAGVPGAALSPEAAEARNIHQVAALIARCAWARRESRGAHYRTDCPAKCAAFARHSVVTGGGEVRFEGTPDAEPRP